MTTNPSELFTPFVPATTNIPEEPDRLRLYLNQKLSQHADVINDKKIGVYVTGVQNFSGEKWWYKTTQVTRNGYQTMLFLPTLISQIINAGSTPAYPIPIVTPGFVITNMWGAASLPCSAIGAGDGRYFSFLPQGDARISFTMSDTTITITTNGTIAAYQGFIVIEYLQNGT